MPSPLVTGGSDLALRARPGVDPALSEPLTGSMNKAFLGMIVAVVVCSPFRAAAADKVQITAARNRVDASQAKAGREGTQAKASEKVTYDMKVQNRTFADLANLTVEYILFVERQRLGEKKGTEVTERITGSGPIATLTPKAPQTVTTSEVTLSKENLVGNYIYSAGGRIKAEDSVTGVWVRVSQDGQMIGQYANPSSVMSRGWDKKESSLRQ